MTSIPCGMIGDTQSASLIRDAVQEILNGLHARAIFFICGGSLADKASIYRIGVGRFESSPPLITSEIHL